MIRHPRLVRVAVCLTLGSGFALWLTGWSPEDGFQMDLPQGVAAEMALYFALPAATVLFVASKAANHGLRAVRHALARRADRRRALALDLTFE